MRTLAFLFGLMVSSTLSFAGHAGHSIGHEMQHGFILAADDKLASHLVATGPHSRQTEITGQLSIGDPQENAHYEVRKSVNQDGGSYFLFQAQGLDLPSLKAGQVLTGHIVESTVGSYEPKNIIVRSAIFKVERVLLNIENPFFGEQLHFSKGIDLTVNRRATFCRSPFPGLVCGPGSDGKCYCRKPR